MTKLESINTMLMYINEEAVTNTELSIIPVANARICLDEQLKILSYTIGSSITDIANADDLIEMYLVRKASFSLFTRMIGFEEKGIDVIKYDIDSTLGNVHEYAYKTVFAGTTYDYAMHFIMSQLSTATSLEQAFNISKGLKKKIDSTYTKIKSLYSYLSDSIIYDYCLVELINISGNEVISIDKSKIVNAIYKEVLNKDISISNYVVDIINSVPVEEQSINTIYDISNVLDKASKSLLKAKRNILAYGWSFNSVTASLSPNNDGRIIVPNTFISIYSTDNKEYIVRDWKIYDKYNANFVFTEPIEFNIIEDINTDDIPAIIFEYIMAQASMYFYGSVSSGRNISTYLKLAQEAKIIALSDETYKIDNNLLTKTYATTLLDMGTL